MRPRVSAPPKPALPGSASAEMPAAHAILGLLEVERGTGHGYDLARHFAEDQPLGAVIHLEPGMLYHHLKKLHRAGWADRSLEQRGTRPPRQIYRITASGRDELRRWLSEPVTRTREIRLEFLVKLYLARRLDHALAHQLIAEQRDTCGRLEAALTAQIAALPSGNDDPFQDETFTRLVLDLRLTQTRAAMAWLARVDAP